MLHDRDTGFPDEFFAKLTDNGANKCVAEDLTQPERKSRRVVNPLGRNAARRINAAAFDDSIALVGIPAPVAHAY